MAAPSICVFFHCGTWSEWPFFESYLQHLKGVVDFDFLVTLRPCANKNESEARKKVFHEFYASMKTSSGECWVIEMEENRGLDIGGFLTSLAFLRGIQRLSYDYILKVHTKRAFPPNWKSWPKDWRVGLMEAVLGSPTQIQKCLHLLKSESSHGMIASKEWIWEEDERDDIARYAESSLLSKTILYETKSSNKKQFVAGTIFWARFAPLVKPFLDMNLAKLVREMPVGKKDWVDAEPQYVERLLGTVMQNAQLNIYGV